MMSRLSFRRLSSWLRQMTLNIDLFKKLTVLVVLASTFRKCTTNTRVAQVAIEMLQDIVSFLNEKGVDHWTIQKPDDRNILSPEVAFHTVQNKTCAFSDSTHLLHLPHFSCQHIRPASFPSVSLRHLLRYTHSVVLSNDIKHLLRCVGRNTQCVGAAKRTLCFQIMSLLISVVWVSVCGQSI